MFQIRRLQKTCHDTGAPTRQNCVPQPQLAARAPPISPLPPFALRTSETSKLLSLLLVCVQGTPTRAYTRCREQTVEGAGVAWKTALPPPSSPMVEEVSPSLVQPAGKTVSGAKEFLQSSPPRSMEAEHLPVRLHGPVLSPVNNTRSPLDADIAGVTYGEWQKSQ